jgi:hypothetical protein
MTIVVGFDTKDNGFTTTAVIEEKAQTAPERFFFERKASKFAARAIAQVEEAPFLLFHPTKCSRAKKKRFASTERESAR